MYQHLHTRPPVQLLKNVSQPVIVLLEMLLAKDPLERFQTPNELLNAIATVDRAAEAKRKIKRQDLRVTLVDRTGSPKQKSLGIRVPKRSVAVLPFDTLSHGKANAYFADGKLENAGFAQTRDQLNRKVQSSPGNALLLSKLGLVDSLLDNKERAISEAKRAVELLPISRDAVDGPQILINLAAVYAWTNETDLAFEILGSLTKMPNGICSALESPGGPRER